MAAMCLIAAAWQQHPRFALALIANRDELHARPTAPAGPDPERPDVYGGRDLEAGGSWLQVSTRGRLAAVTNVRVGRNPEPAPRSRGALVRDFVRGEVAAAEFTAALTPIAAEHGRYNLLVWDGAALAFATNHPQAETHAVTPGVHAMSNGAFDATWPKSGHATRALRAWLDSPSIVAHYRRTGFGTAVRRVGRYRTGARRGVAGHRRRHRDGTLAVAAVRTR